MPQVVWVPGSTEKVCQLTGEKDVRTGKPTANETETNFNLRGTDGGASFEHDGKLWFVWGATHPTDRSQWRPWDRPSVAYSDATDGERLVEIDWVTAPDGGYRALAPTAVTLGAFEVPTGGFSYDGVMYVFTSNGSKLVPGKGAVLGKSVLLRSRNGGRTFSAVRTIGREKLVYLSPVVVSNRDWPGLPDANGRGLLMFGSGREYRRSNVCLAYAPLGEIQNPAAMRYFAGMDGAKPRWSEREADCKDLFDLPCVGENSVVYDRNLKRWLILYNCEPHRGPRGIHFRTAENPWGPWSDFGLLFEPGRDKAWGQFMHRRGTSDGLAEAGRGDVDGSEYGPFIVERFTRGKPEQAPSAGRTTIYYTLSTWNPYQVVLMRSTLEVV